MDISELKNYVIIVTSDEPYSKMWHTQLIYTEFLSKANTVYYINPPEKWKPTNIFKNTLAKRQENENLSVLNYINKLPASIKVFNRFNENYNEKKIAKELKKGNAQKVIIWHFDSYRSSLANHLFDKKIEMKRIYHVIDPFYKNPIDRWLGKIADLIIITSPRNNKYYSDFSNKIINVSQSFDIELQKQWINDQPSVRSKLSPSYFVLLGTISDDIDFDWLLSLLKNKDFKLVIIGKIINVVKSKEKLDLVLKHSQVEYLGLLSPQEFYPILKGANAGLIVYNEERRAKVCSPLKALNYIISGLPVITNIDCEIPELLDCCIYFREHLNEIDHLIIKSLNKNLIFDIGKSDKFVNEISIIAALKKIIVKL